MRVPMPGAQTGCAELVGNPLHLSATPVEYRSAPPVLGAHTEPVLRDVLGLAPRALAELRRNGAIAVGPELCPTQESDKGDKPWNHAFEQRHHATRAGAAC